MGKILKKLKGNKINVKFLEAYKELFNPRYRYIIFYGGRYSGKSFAIALSLLIRASEKKLRIVCTREIQNTIKESVYQLLSDLIEKYKLPNYRIMEKAIYNKNSSEFIFKGLQGQHRDSDEMKSLEGADIAWVEEAQKVTKRSFDVLIPTIRKTGSQIIMSFNPLKKDDPVMEFVKNPHPRTFSKFCNYDILEGTGFLSDVIKEEIEHCKKIKPELYKHIYKGETRRTSETLIIHSEWFKRYEVEPKFEYRFLVGDTAQKTKEANDYSVFTVWGVSKERRLYLLDLIRGKWEAPELETQAKDFWSKHIVLKNGVLRVMSIEDKASGTGLIQTLQRKESIPIEAIQRNKDKYTRCLDTLGYIKSGYVFLPESAWFVSDFLTECEGFTSNDQHEYDDQVDNLLDACDKTFGIGLTDAGVAVG